jgi:hypothetical protein
VENVTTALECQCTGRVVGTFAPDTAYRESGNAEFPFATHLADNILQD